MALDPELGSHLDTTAERLSFIKYLGERHSLTFVRASPALGDLAHHFPDKDAPARANLQWGAPTPQHTLDTALAWSVVNRHFDVAEFLLAHGADINASWSSHELSSILHELVFHANYESMQFLISATT